MERNNWRIPIFFLLLLLVCTKGFGQDRYAVFYTFKGQNNFSLERGQDYLSEAAMERRSKEQIALDSLDLPVSDVYAQKLRPLCEKILYHSKWLNASLVVAQEAQVSEIEQLDFVEQVVYVAKGGLSTPGGRIKPDRQEDRKFSTFPMTAYPTTENLRVVSEFQNSLLGIERMHEEGFRGRGILVGVLDAGFVGADTITALRHILTEGRLLAQRDFVNPQNEHVFGAHQHGTNVLSLIAGEKEGEFVAGAPEASFFLARTEDASSEYAIEEYNWVRALEYADSMGVSLVNSSLGYFDFDDPSMNYTREELDGKTAIVTRGANVAASRGILIITSAGNSGSSLETLLAPADSPEILSIGAVNQALEVTGFSSRGPTADGRIKPDLATLGSSVSLYRADGRLSTSQGTSFSAPQITALAAGLWQAHPEWTREELIRNLLESGSQASSPDVDLGYGIPDFEKAHLGLILALDEKEEAHVFKLYPNPLYENQLKIRFGTALQANLTLVDPSGKVVYEGELNRSSSQEPYFLDFESVHSGLYILILRDQSESQIEKLIRF